MTERKINTIYNPKPMPTRGFDWCATFDGYEPGDPMGYGATEEAAIKGLHAEVESAIPAPPPQDNAHVAPGLTPSLPTRARTATSISTRSMRPTRRTGNPARHAAPASLVGMARRGRRDRDARGRHRTMEQLMPDHILSSENAERMERIGLATKLRFAADCLEREGINTVRHWTARDVCIAALNDIDRAFDYGKPGKGISDLLGDNHA